MPTRLSDKFTNHLRLVETLTNAGITPPLEWLKLRERFTAYQRLQKPATDRLANAVVAGTKDDLTALRAFALAEQASPQDEAKVDNQIAACVERKLIEIYASAAQGNYQKAATQFDAAATAFTNVASIVDPETDAATMAMVDTPNTQRQAWSDAEKYAHQLDSLVPVLLSAANLAGLRINANNDAAMIALCCDPGTCHKRRTWEAWNSNGRCGHWSALTTLGVAIRACSLEAHQPYPEPKPLERRRVSIATGIYRDTVVDPEDSDYPAAKNAPPLRHCGANTHRAGGQIRFAHRLHTEIRCKGR